MVQFIQIEDDGIREALGRMRNRQLTWDLFATESDVLTTNLLGEVVQKEGLWAARDVVVVPVWRSGIAFACAIRLHLANARTGWMGLERKEIPGKGVEIREYYWKPPELPASTAKWVVMDPMLATGESMKVVIERLIALDVPPKNIIAVVCIAAPEALALFDKQPWGGELKIYGAALDQGLDENFYIVPGLGDYGDRYFGTAPGSGLHS